MAKKKAFKLTEENYYSPEADKLFFSVSQFKSFERCEAQAMATLNGEYTYPQTDSLLIGSYVDRAVEGTLDSFKTEHPEIYTQKGELKSGFKKAEKILEKMNSDKVFSKYLSGDKQKIITFELGGVMWKAKLDVYHKNKAIVDLKCMQNFSNLIAYRYELQGAVYQYGIEQSDGKHLPFYIACVTKEEEPDLDIFEIPQDVLDLALIEITEKLPHFIDVKNGKVAPTRCGECAYCKKTKKASVRNWLELM